MATFNEKQKTQSKADRTRKENFEGGEAFEPEDARNNLYQLTINNLVEDQFYLDAEESLDQLTRVFDEVAREHPSFIAKLAAHAREDKGLRTIPQVFVVLGAEYPEVRKHFPDYATEIIQRADEPCEIVAAYNQIHGRQETRKMPNEIRETLEKALNQFNEYHFAKYDRPQRSVRPVDVLNLVHPEPKDEEQAKIFDKITKGEKDNYPEISPLETPDTWETYLTGRVEELRNSYEDSEDVPEEELKEVKKNAFEDLLEDNKLNMFAKIRNLRNMLEVGVSPEKILDEDDLEYVRSGDHKMFPFRFYQAYKALKEAEEDWDSPIEDISYLEEWLSEAVDSATQNLPDSLVNTYAVADISASMDYSLSDNSQMTQKEIAELFTASLFQKGAKIGAFADKHERVNPHSGTPTLQVMKEIENSSPRGSTYGYKVPKYLTQNEVEVDRLVLLTDEQIYGARRQRGEKTFKEWIEEYRAKVNPGLTVYIFDLSAYPDLSTPEDMDQVFRIKGWNESVLEFIESAENPGQVIQEIADREPVQ